MSIWTNNEAEVPKAMKCNDSIDGSPLKRVAGRLN